MKSVMITGCSSGFGLAIAAHFLQQGWRVVATMRTPRQDALPQSQNLQILELDVTDGDSIRQAVRDAGPIDVLINNAGIGWMNALEGTPPQMMREIFETNTLGVMAMIQAVLPQFRERRAGVIINVSSATTLKPLPLLSVYTASKAAVNAFSESVALELEPFNIRVRIVLPGRAPDTSFGSTARNRMQDGGAIPDAYASYAQSLFAARDNQKDAAVTHTQDVVAAVWQAATDPATPMRIPAGADAVALVE